MVYKWNIFELCVSKMIRIDTDSIVGRYSDTKVDKDQVKVRFI